MIKKIICFIGTMTFLLSLTVTTFANETNEAKTIFTDSFQKTSTALTKQLETSIESSNLNTMLAKNFTSPKEMEFIFDFQSGTDSFNNTEINKFKAQINLQYDIMAFKFYGKINLKNIDSDENLDAEFYLSQDVIGFGTTGQEFFYQEMEYDNTEVYEYMDLEKFNQISEKSEKIDQIVINNINKGEFISNGNNSYTLKLSSEIVNTAVEEIINEIKYDENYISILKKTSHLGGLTDAEIAEGLDSMVTSLSEEDVEIVYDIEINDKGLIAKQSIKLLNEDDGLITIYTELAEDKNILSKIKITILESDAYEEEVLFETSGKTTSEDGITNYKADIYLKSYFITELTNVIGFNYSLNKNVIKDNFTFSFIGNEIIGLPVEIKNLVGSLDIDTTTGNISYTIENGKVDKFYGIENIMFNMSFKIKSISSDIIKLPENAIKIIDRETYLPKNKVFG